MMRYLMNRAVPAVACCGATYLITGQHPCCHKCGDLIDWEDVRDSWEGENGTLYLGDIDTDDDTDESDEVTDTYDHLTGFDTSFYDGAPSSQGTLDQVWSSLGWREAAHKTAPSGPPKPDPYLIEIPEGTI